MALKIMNKGGVVMRYKHYDMDDDEVEKDGRFCPRCGSGVFMADHGDRFTCGRCDYTEWKKE